MEYESQRLATFSQAVWPHTGSSLTPERLAAAGFFHAPTSKTADRVVCFACENALTNWDPTDDPWIEHKTWYPQCPFVLGKATWNVPVQKAASTLLPAGFRLPGRDKRAAQGETNAANASESASRPDSGSIAVSNGESRPHQDANSKPIRFDLNTYIKSLKGGSSKDAAPEEVGACATSGSWCGSVLRLTCELQFDIGPRRTHLPGISSSSARPADRVTATAFADLKWSSAPDFCPAAGHGQQHCLPWFQ